MTLNWIKDWVTYDAKTKIDKKPKLPEQQTSPDYEKLTQDFQGQCDNVKEQCRLERNELSDELLKQAYKKLEKEAKRNPKTINALNKELWIDSKDFSKELFIKILLNPELRRFALWKTEWLTILSILKTIRENKYKTTQEPIKTKYDYEMKMKNKVETLEKALNLPAWLSTSIIEQESMYWAQVSNSWGSIWLMQLTSQPFLDMTEDPKEYWWYLSKIPEDIINSIEPIQAKNIVIEIIREMKKQNPNLNKLKSLFKEVHRFARKIKWKSERFDMLNVVFWSIYLANCNESKVYYHNNKWEITWLKKIKEDEVNKITTESLINDLEKHKWYKLNTNDKKLIWEILKELKAKLTSDNPKYEDIKREYLVAREYNGSSKKTWYAINVMVAREFNQIKNKAN